MFVKHVSFYMTFSHKFTLHFSQVFIDVTGTLDQANHQLFKLMCASPAGGVPLGFMVLSGKDESLIAEGLEELKKLLPRKAFFKRFKRFTL